MRFRRAGACALRRDAVGLAVRAPMLRRAVAAIGAASGAIFLAGALAPSFAQGSCTPARGSPAKVTQINERGELALEDGRLVKMAGIDLPGPTQERPRLAQAAREALSDWLLNHSVTVRPVLATPDRWGRTVAYVFAPPDFATPDISPVSAGFVLLDAGLARARPSPETRDCATLFLEAEMQARQSGLGLWGDPYYGVIDATDSAHLADRAGTFVLVEGRVTRVGTGRARTFVNLGHGRDSFTFTVPKRSNGSFEASGLALGSLVGVRLRVRGILDTRFGPQIEVSDPENVERL
ncbi:MAG: thermonuclease family protein [Methylobacteriaceae bacterium]|nr:thermonuclease family protein [Methylobacteriaceae bacterium]MBV9246749.1 thermonuclease family protein [Methylobacteriaceae bacterium]